MRSPLPPTAAAIGFIDCINRSDVEGLNGLMAAGHTLRVFDEPPLVGRAANAQAWHGYFTSYPRYVIYPRQIVARGETVAILGSTTGSHLGLADEEEIALRLIWLVMVIEGQVCAFRLIEDSEDHRAEHGLA